MVKKRKPKPEKKESLLHKLVTAVVSAVVMAIVAGLIGYKLNTKLPELYYRVYPPQNKSSRYLVYTEVSNLGLAPASELIIRYTFDKKVMYCDYNYSEGLGGKLPPGNVEGGKGCNELLLSLPRLLPDDILKASFVFEEPGVNSQVKVFSKEVVGRPYSEWEEKTSRFQKFLHKLNILGQSIIYQIQKHHLNIPVLNRGVILKAEAAHERQMEYLSRIPTPSISCGTITTPFEPRTASPHINAAQ